MKGKLSDCQKALLKRLQRQPLIARKTIKTDKGKYLGLRPWKFERGDKKTVLSATVAAVYRLGLVAKFDMGDRLEIHLVRK